MRVAIIGAGPSGLVTLKYLATAHRFLDTKPIEVRLFESEAEVGGTFFARTYEDAELVSSTQLTTFSDWRPRPDDADFLSANRYLEYLRGYCTHFGLWPSINLSTTVISVTRRPGGGHTVVYQGKNATEPSSWDCDAIAVCSGLHVAPSIPKLEGVERVPVVLHSSEFKTREQFGVDKTILVLGSGETGSDVGYLAITSPTKRVVMSHRSGFHIAPKRNPTPIILPILGRKPKPRRTLPIPVDSSRASLFDTAYIHPWLRNGNLLWSYYNWYVKAILWTTTGTTHGLDQWVGGKEPGKEGASQRPSGLVYYFQKPILTETVFFNKSNKTGPYISYPYRPAKKSLLEKIRSSILSIPVVDTDGRQIDLAPWPERIDEEGVVHFRDSGRPEYERMKNERIKPDVLVFCTGYQQVFPFFNGNNGSPAFAAINGTVSKTGNGTTKGHTYPDSNFSNSVEASPRPYPTAFDANVRNIWNRDDPTVAFIGFIRPSLGAIPPLSEMQAQLWVSRVIAPPRPDLLPKPLKPLLPSEEPHYRLLHHPDSRVQYGVDHESYVYQLALDMDSAPSFTEVVGLGWKGWLRGREGALWRLPLVWALGANFTVKFRMRGPWRWDGAADVLTDELWATVARRGLFFGHFTLSALPMMIFGPISLIFYVYASLVGLFNRIIGRREVEHKVTVNGYT